MAASLREQILANFAARLETIKTVNGYETNVVGVYYDEIPMGLDFAEHQVPAILLIDRADVPKMEHHKLNGEWELKLQLWHNPNKDSVMLRFVRDVYKAIYSNHPASNVNGAFRAIHPRIVEVVPNTIVSDLNMIEANRVYDLSFFVRYRTELFDL
jgi:hypothetical protein